MPLRPRLSLRVRLERRARRLDEDRDLILLPERVAIERLRALPTADVYVAAVGQRPRIEVVLLPVAAPAYARLADVVEGSPYEVAGDVRMIEHTHPVTERFERERLRRYHHAPGHASVVCLVPVLHVVVARNVERGEVRV